MTTITWKTRSPLLHPSSEHSIPALMAAGSGCQKRRDDGHCQGPVTAPLKGEVQWSSSGSDLFLDEQRDQSPFAISSQEGHTAVEKQFFLGNISRHLEGQTLVKRCVPPRVSTGSPYLKDGARI